MVNALFSSKVSGTKDFELDGIHFGWKEIQVHILSIIYMYLYTHCLKPLFFDRKCMKENAPEWITAWQEWFQNSVRLTSFETRGLSLMSNRQK